MRTLWLLRHAKASLGRDDQSDHERSLEGRGREAAERMGRHLAKRGVTPGLALCSTAVRARETLEHLARGLGVALEDQPDRDLYLAGPEEIVACLRPLPDDLESVLVVGHNPGIGQLAAQLARRGDAALRARLREKFPTGALAELRFDVEHWREIARGGELASYVTPKRLDD